MKFIYLTNGIYDQNTLINNVTTINDQNKKEKISMTEIIYGGNQKCLDANVSEENFNDFLENMRLLNQDLKKYIMYGGFDFNSNKLNDELYNCNYLTKSIDFYGNLNNFKNIFNLDYKLVDNTLLLFINNQINYITPVSTPIVNTCLKFLFSINSSKYRDDMSIDDLVKLQIDELSSILKNNINIKSIIFISQTPLFILDYQTNKMQINKSLKFLEWINRYFYLLKDIKLYTISGDLNNRNESSTITVQKKDNLNNKIGELTINQYIIGTNLNLSKEEPKQNLQKNSNETEFTDQIEIGVYNIDDTKSTFIILYKITNTNQNYGFIEFEINNNINSIPVFHFVDSKKKIIEKNSKVEGFKKVLKEKNIFVQNIFDNVDISISDSYDLDNNIQMTEEGDIYKEKYLKYKKKLHKLRNNKKY